MVAEATRAFAELIGYLDHHAEAITAICTIFVAAFTGTLWWSTRKLWRVTDQTLRHAELTAKQQLRAYVSLIAADVIIEGVKIIFVLKFQNAGQTPASDVSVYLRPGAVDETRGKFEPEKHSSPAERKSRGTIGPGSTMEVRHPADFSPLFPDATELAEFVQAIEAEKLRLYVHGDIDYEDAFEDRWTYFFAARVVKKLGASGWGIAPVAEGNYEKKNERKN